MGPAEATPPPDDRSETDKMLNAFGLPTDERRCSLLVMKAEEIIANVSRNTGNLYGDMRDPFSKAGYVREFAFWCRAGPNEVFNGVMTHPKKQRYKVPRAPDVIVYEYLKDHFLLRKQYNKRSKQYTINKPHSTSALKNVVKALCKLYRYQCASWPEGPKDFEKIVGPIPCADSGILSSLIEKYIKDAAEQRRANHAPRGLGSLCTEGYTEKQNQQMCEFGLTNHSLRHHSFSYMTEANVRSIHTHHVLSSNLALRFDDRQKLEWSQLCTQPSSDRTKETGIPLACFVLEKRKNNQSRQKCPVYSHRHLDDPTKCSFFALALELFGQTHMDGLAFLPSDFVPIPNMGSDGCHDGTYTHPWYDRCIFMGNTKAKKGACSEPDPYTHCLYPTVLSHFNRMYPQIDPPIVGYHKLHLERGQTARNAEKAGTRTEQIAQHGHWKIRDALRVHYLTGIPMEMIRFLAGFDPKLVPGQPLPIIRRNLLKPSQEMQDLVFPFVQPVLDAMKKDRDAKKADPKHVCVYPTTECGALVGFLNLSQLLACTFLQDCAVLFEDMNQHPIFTTPILQSRQFHLFRLELGEKMEAYEAFPMAEKSTGPAGDPSAEKSLRLVKKLIKLLTEVSTNFETVIDSELREIIQEFKSPLLGNNGVQWAASSSLSKGFVLPEEEEVSVSGTVDSLSPSPGRKRLSPKEVRSTMPMRQVQLFDPMDHPTDKTQWPRICPPPPWATSKWFLSNPATPKIVVEEYLFGYPHPPAIKDLEEVYGGEATHIVRGQSWRSHPDRKQANNKRKQWCNRLPLYKFIDQDPNTAVERLEAYIEEHFGEELKALDKTCQEPGPTHVRKAISKMKRDAEGAHKRRDTALARAKKRKENKERNRERATVVIGNQPGASKTQKEEALLLLLKKRRIEEENGELESASDEVDDVEATATA